MFRLKQATFDNLSWSCTFQLLSVFSHICWTSLCTGRLRFRHFYSSCSLLETAWLGYVSIKSSDLYNTVQTLCWEGDGWMARCRGELVRLVFATWISWFVNFSLTSWPHISYLGNNFDLLKMRKNLKLIFGSWNRHIWSVFGVNFDN